MINAIVCDIEGTTTDIAFVHDVLFPYAVQHLPDFVRQHAEDAAVRDALAALRVESEQPDATLDTLIDTLLHYIAIDKKSPALKTLQGLVWVDGYTSQQFTGHLYEDAYTQLKSWHQQGIPLYIYSSGSVAAQKLLFAHTDHGDLTPLLSGYFDTAVGAKRDVNAYQTIRNTLGLPATEILFLSDIHQELDAARADGWHTIQLIRGDTDPNSTHPQVSTFDAIDLNELSA